MPPSRVWIDESHKIWLNIERGAHRTDAETIEAMMAAAGVMEDVAHRFLTDWRERRLNLDISAELAELYRLDKGWESRRRGGRGRERGSGRDNS